MHRQDRLDARIVRELGSLASLQWNVRESYASIAKRLGVDEETVRTRVKRMERDGVVQGWRLVLNPSLLGRASANLMFDVNDLDGKPKVISQLKLIEGIIVILDFQGKSVSALYLFENEQSLDRTAHLITSLSGDDKPTVTPFPFPVADITMSSTDWKIAWAMKDDPRKSISKIAREVGVTTRTVTRRLAALTKARAFYLVGVPNFRRSVGISCSFLIFYTDAKKKSSADKYIQLKFERIAFAYTLAPGGSNFVIGFENMTEAEDAYKKIQELDGVSSARMGIMKDFILVTDWLDEQIDKHIRSPNVNVNC